MVLSKPHLFGSLNWSAQPHLAPTLPLRLVFQCSHLLHSTSRNRASRPSPHCDFFKLSPGRRWYWWRCGGHSSFSPTRLRLLCRRISSRWQLYWHGESQRHGFVAAVVVVVVLILTGSMINSTITLFRSKIKIKNKNKNYYELVSTIT